MLSSTDKKDFLFRFVEPHIRVKLRLDDEAYYSTTDQLTANKIARALARIVPPSATITDATACIGGATYAFANTFRHVNAIELDHSRFMHLCHNINGVLKTNGKVTCIHGDAIVLCPQLQQDLVFLDPPWGGPEYKSMQKVSLSLSGLPLSDVCRIIAQATRYIAIKVPVNFNETDFCKEVEAFATIVLRDTQLRKMNLIVLEVCQSPNLM